MEFNHFTSTYYYISIKYSLCILQMNGQLTSLLSWLKQLVGVVTCQLQRDFLNVTTSNSSTNLNDHLLEFNEDSTVILYII